MYHFRIVEHYVVVRVTHAIVGVQIVGKVAVQIVQYDEHDFVRLFEIPFYQNNGNEIPFGRNFDGLMALLPVYVNGRTHGVPLHISTDVCMLFHYKAFKEQFYC